jgi:hypothetical protein
MKRVLCVVLVFSAVALAGRSVGATCFGPGHPITGELRIVETRYGSGEGDPVLLEPKTVKVVQRGDPPLPPVSDIEREIAGFVSGTYLILNRLSPYEIERFYGPHVDYFGRRALPLIWVMKEKLRHYRRHPIRHYELMPGSILISPLPGMPGAYDVSFDYWYQIGRHHWIEEGLGRAELTLDLRYRPIRIYREDGGAIESW